MDEKFHVSSKGVLVRDGAILLIEYFEDHVGTHYNMPGGKMRPEENARQTVRRKMMEEAGADVDVGPLLFLYEYIGATHDYVGGDKHTVSLVFQCTLRPGSDPGMHRCTHPDTIQTDVSWIPLERFPQVLFWPNVAERIVAALAAPPREDPYWGDIL